LSATHAYLGSNFNPTFGLSFLYSYSTFIARQERGINPWNKASSIQITL